MSPEECLSRTAAVFGVQPTDLLLKNQRNQNLNLVRARQAAAHTLYYSCGCSYIDVARIIGYSGHSSAVAAIEVSMRRSLSDALYSSKLDTIVGDLS